MELDSPTLGYSFRQLRSCLPVEIIPGRVYLGPSSSLAPAVLQLVGISAVCLCAKEHANAAEVVASFPFVVVASFPFVLAVSFPFVFRW
jgi:hypothetical protein